MKYIGLPFSRILLFLRRRWPQLTLLAVSSLFCFALGEVAIRLIVHVKYQRRVAAFSHELWLPVPDRPEEIFRLHPGIQGVGHLPLKKVVTWNYTVNRDGFRGRPLEPKRPGVTRILCLGDSYTFGWAVDQSLDPYPRVLERLLNGDAPTTRVEVLNLGIPGYNTRMEDALLRELAGRYQPDLVVAAFVMNDAEPPGPEIPIPPQTRYRFCRSWLFTKLECLLNDFVLPARWAIRTGENVHDLDFLAAYAPGNPKGRDVRAALDSMGRFCRQRKLPLLVCIMPDFYSPIDATYRWRPIHQQIGAWTRELSIPAIDLLPDFEGCRIEDYHVVGDGHPSALAHQRIAEIIARQLRQLHFVAP